jgi:hypothetical protein
VEEDSHRRRTVEEEDPHCGGATSWRRRTRTTAASWRCHALEEDPCYRRAMEEEDLHHRRAVEEEDPRCHRIMKEEDLCHGGSTAWRRRTHTAAAPWRSRTCAVEEEEPTTMVPRHRRGSRGRRDAGTRGRHALKELQQQRPLESYR